MVPSPSALSLAGQYIDNGRLLLRSLIGSGAHGAIYHAWDESIQVEYAVKVVLKRGQDFKWRREIEMHNRVSDHPNVVTIHKVIMAGDFACIVLDYHPGGDLSKLLAYTKKYAGEDKLIKSVLLQILDAVEYCHSQGVFHRDLKPQNILCSKDGSQVFLADFGLATLKDVSTTFGCGTAPYMSPESIKADHDIESYSTKISDVWALGIIFTNIVASRAPWNRAVLQDGCYQEYIRHRGYLRNCLPFSRHAHHLIQRCLDPNPPTRITISMLCDEIKQIDSFYLSLAEIAMASNTVRRAAAVHGPLTKIRLSEVYASDITSSNTDSDTDGPITPPVAPCEPLGIEISEGVGIGESELQVPAVEKKQVQRPLVQRMVHSLGYLFRTQS